MPEQEELGMKTLDEVAGGRSNAKELITKLKNLSPAKKGAVIAAILAAIGTVYGAKKINDNRNKKNASEVTNEPEDNGSSYNEHDVAGKGAFGLVEP